MGLFRDSTLEAPLNTAISRQLFDNLGDIIWVSPSLEIRVHPKRAANISEDLTLWKEFLAGIEKPTWVMGYTEDPNGFFVKIRSIYEYLYDISALGMLHTLSCYYYQASGRKIEDFVSF